MRFDVEVDRLRADIADRPFSENMQSDFVERLNCLIDVFYNSVPELPEGASLDNVFYPFVIRKVYVEGSGDDLGVVDYLSGRILARFSSQERVPCADYFFEELSAVSECPPRVKFERMRSLGDKFLFIAGLFPDNRKGPGVNYYATCGSMAFRMAADLAELSAKEEVGRTLEVIGSTFDYYVDRLQDIARSYLSGPDKKVICSLYADAQIDLYEARKRGDDLRARELEKKVDYFQAMVLRGN
ncbi:hypothetical protein D6825_04025 [Candidatus Woesearchaeota archaeon]|nr:MAG: hypothetical protein D6825_04025 [Candidatus Woesearchaeota archaeon]